MRLCYFMAQFVLKAERNCFNLVSLCRASFRRGHFSQLQFSQHLLLIWPIHASYIGACPYTCIIWCMYLYSKTPNQLQKWAFSYISPCTWIQGNGGHKKVGYSSIKYFVWGGGFKILAFKKLFAKNDKNSLKISMLSE